MNDGNEVAPIFHIDDVVRDKRDRRATWRVVMIGLVPVGKKASFRRYHLMTPDGTITSIKNECYLERA